MVAGMVRPPDRGPPMGAEPVKGLLLAGDPSFEESSSSSSESESAATALPAAYGHAPGQGYANTLSPRPSPPASNSLNQNLWSSICVRGFKSGSTRLLLLHAEAH